MTHWSNYCSILSLDNCHIIGAFHKRQIAGREMEVEHERLS